MHITPDETFLLGLLHKRKRSGWLARGVPIEEAESVAEHTLKVLLAVRAYGQGYDVERASRLALAHDIGECIEEDYMPGQLSADEKHVRERRAVFAVTEPLASRDALRGAWHEYEAQRSPEARIVKVIDMLDACVQAVAYDARGYARMHEFWEWAPRKIVDPRFTDMPARIAAMRGEAAPYGRYFAMLTGRER